MKTETLFSRKSDEWTTPDDLFQALDAEFCFNLDPCCTDTTSKCRRYYTAKEDGLKQDWGGV